ncbi:helix-turn-helix domain-containing protein [Paenibacillus hemerocallicola]|uniref:Helix-turn-helix domain-containing protein n=1 Tax=Paenibacillus hemerocallicola TaxID=1172614 RepID=A0A5C4SXJ3_9BACL|nr:AraC family transcriptional regulator [Paenibacillus hemerocallicola]TNJ60834.1 helix-turn-helix domain-containing protein [Paenibacillus hemerocallicola]
MNLNENLLKAPPILNTDVENGFKSYPVYARKDLLRAHNYYLHTQPGIEINLTLEGKAAYVIGDQVRMQYPGQLLVFSGKVPHQVYIDPSCQYKRTVVCFDESGMREAGLRSAPNLEMLPLPDMAYHQVHLEPEMFAEIKQIASRLSDEIQEKHTGWKQVVSSQLSILTVYIRRSMEASANNGNSDLVSLCCDYIGKHLPDNLSLKSMASMFHVSPEHLIRLFKREKKITFYQFVLQQRVSESKRMLLNCPDTTLTDIAYAVGFPSAAQFSRVFRASTGVLPSQFRNRMAKS